MNSCPDSQYQDNDEKSLGWWLAEQGCGKQGLVAWLGFFVSLTQARAIWEGETSNEDMLL